MEINKTNFYKSCIANDLERVKQLHLEGFDIHAEDELCLRGSCLHGAFDVAIYLISCGCSLSARDNYVEKWAKEFLFEDVLDFVKEYKEDR